MLSQQLAQTDSSVHLRCGLSTCVCECFTPNPVKPRSCEQCAHGWVAHALNSVRPQSTGPAPVGQTAVFGAEPVRASAVFDVAALVLYGAQALPTRLKILLEQLFSALPKEESMDVLHSLGWTCEDFHRSYVWQDNHLKPVEHWTMCTAEEEQMIMQHFLRFGETRTQTLLMLQDVYSCKPELFPPYGSFLPVLRGPVGDLRAFIRQQHRSTASVFVRHALLQRQDREQKITPWIRNDTMPVSTALASTHTNGWSTILGTGDHDDCGGKMSSLERLAHAANLESKLPQSSVLCGAKRSRSSTPSDESSQEHAPHSTSSASPLSDSELLSTPGPASTVSPPPQRRSHSANAYVDDPGRPTTRDLSIKSSASSAPELEHRTNEPHSNDQLDVRHSEVGLRRFRSLAANRDRAGRSPHPYSYLGVNPVTGKKRVQCSACMKTFCDRGALKIHVSAVHLREMHRCTIDGCQMMFSSRRSRNRHSANTNPKLHMSHPRRAQAVTPIGRIVSPVEATEQYNRLQNEASSAGGSRERHESFESDASSAHTEGQGTRCCTQIIVPNEQDARDVANGRVSGVRKRKSEHPTKCLSSGVSQFAGHMDSSAAEFTNAENEQRPLTMLKQTNDLPLDFSKSGLDDALDDHSSALSRLTSLTENLSNSIANVVYAGLEHSTPEDMPACGSPNDTDALSRPSSTASSTFDALSLAAANRQAAPNGSNITMMQCKTPSGTIEIPVYEDNPRQCVACKKVFQNHFSVKTHYQNVHMKIMHRCTVEGCNAKFPSKRSRDRHSSNWNLHNKLLSTNSREVNPVSFRACSGRRVRPSRPSPCSPSCPITGTSSGPVTTFRTADLPFPAHMFGYQPALFGGALGLPGAMNPLAALQCAAALQYTAAGGSSLFPSVTLPSPLVDLSKRSAVSQKTKTPQ